MENYLTGREGGNNIDVSGADSSFRPFLSQPSEDTTTVNPELENVPQGQSEVIFDEKDCPKVEVISVDSKPTEIVIHLDDGRLLKINCVY